MALTTYQKKRSFDKTPEPVGGKAKGDELRFVIQKHDASRLHYDFRLEMEGVLKSWAVPKGPSTDPSVKRLAMMVEDHPYDYRNFEGIIPEGNYGAGTVIVWDEGTYTPIENLPDKKSREKHLLRQLKEGSVKIVLNGKKLKGEFALVRTNGMGENSWLLIKHKDKYAAATDITKKDKSVQSGKTIEKIANTSNRIWQSNRVKNEPATKKKAARKPAPETGKNAAAVAASAARTAVKAGSATKNKVAAPKAPATKKNDDAAKARSTKSKTSAVKGASTKTQAAAAKRAAPKNKAAVPKVETDQRQTLQGTAAVQAGKPGAAKSSDDALLNAPEAPFPATMSPMLATLVDKPFEEPGWIYEVKWDGYRALALCDGSEVNIISRNNKSFNEKFYPVYEAVKAWGLHAVVDGEITVINDQGVSNFGSLQNWRSEADGQLIYYVFDIIWLDGRDLTGLSLTERRALLEPRLPSDGIIRMSASFATSAVEFLEAAGDMGLEGIIAKKVSSTYHPGERTRDWLKIKVNKRHEVVIGGFTQNEGSSKLFSSLLVGVYENGALQYTGKIGTGFTDKLQKDMLAKFKRLIIDKPPFTSTPDVNKPSRFRPNPPHASVTWLKPELVCEVSYAEVTSDGVMRHPSFEGLREDKQAKQVVRETAVETSEAVASASKPAPKKARASDTDKLLKPFESKDRKTLLNPTDESQVRNINGHELKFSNLSKIYWPAERYTKRDLLNYYYQVAPYILPYLKERPQSLNRFPNGIDGQSFYQKDMTGKAPDWVELFPYTTSDEENKNYMVCNKESDLLFMVNLGCIEIHPWSSTRARPDNPDWCLIDLDPSDKNTFDQVVTVAQTTKQVLDEIGVEGYCKTSGSTGMHIYIPLQPQYSYDECQLFGRWIATQVNERLPDITSIERIVKKRRGKLYVDFLQNRPGATLAAPYSARPKPGATVSMPLHWEEVKKGLSIKDFTIRNAMARIKSEGDIFKPVLSKGVDLTKILKKLG